jgi:hypothetical protein
MNRSLIFKLRSLGSALGAQSISIGTGPEQAILTCIPACIEVLGDVRGLANQVLGLDFLTIGKLKEAQILWAGSQGMGRLTCTQELGWCEAEFIPGGFDPVLSLILTGVEDIHTWIHAFDVETVYLNGNRVGNGLPFSIGDHHGQVIHDENIDRLTILQDGQFTPFQQESHLVIRVQDNIPIPNLTAFHQELALGFRGKYLRTDQDFSPDQVRTAVDLESLKGVAEHPQDLAALLGLGLRLKPNLERQEIGWEVERYLLHPIVLSGESSSAVFDATICIEADLPISPAGLAPDWAPTFIPKIPEQLPEKLLQETQNLGVYLVETITAGDAYLPYLLLQPGCKFLANGEEQTSDRPLLLLARNGTKASTIAGDLAHRSLFLGIILRLYSEMSMLEQQQIVLDRYPFRFDPLLAALWIVGKAQILTRGEAASLSHWKKLALSVSLATAAEIAAIRKKKPDPDADQALAQALEALAKKREKLIGRLSRSAQGNRKP